MTEVKPTDCICSYNTHRPEGQDTTTDISRNPKCPVHNPPKTITLTATQAFLLNDIARRAMAYRRLVQDVAVSCEDTIKTNLNRSLYFDAALKADVEWKLMESSIDSLYEISTSMSRGELSRIRQIAVTPTRDDGSFIRHWFKEGEEV